jgi:hypothetical protein
MAVGIGYALDLGSDGSGAASDADRATSVAASTTDDASRIAGSRPRRPSATASQKKVIRAETPGGVCRRPDISVAPQIRESIGGAPVTIELQIGVSGGACHWRFAPETVAVKVTSGSDEIWSSQDCPGAISPEKLVLRRNKPVPVSLEWSAKWSDESCSDRTDWAKAGWYHVAAAALGGEPDRLHFELSKPAPSVVTRPPKPERADDKSQPTKKPTRAASGAVEPNGTPT